MNYFEMVNKFKESIDFTFMIIIDNKTMRVRYSILSNLYCDPPMIVTEMLSTGDYNKTSYRKKVAILKKLLNKRVYLHSTNNDTYHTRLVYKLK